MKMLGEDGEVAIWIVDASVVMVRHRDRECDMNLGADRGQDQAVEEGVIRVSVGAQKEAPLGTTARNHVVTTWHDLAR